MIVSDTGDFREQQGSQHESQAIYTFHSGGES